MKYTSAAAFRQALETRLRAISRDQGSSLVRLRKAVAFDRLLARLLVAAPGRWVLKGGLALDYRFGARARTTKDMDLATQAGEEAATTDLLVSGDRDLGDYFTFAIERTAKLDQLLEGSAVRFHVRADLAGRRFEDFVVDIGFDMPLDWEPDVLVGPDLLGFADIDPVAAPALPLELQIAEKVHAYARAYGGEGIGSTRVKDLVDLALVATTAELDAVRLIRAITETFERRSGRGGSESAACAAARLGGAVSAPCRGDRTRGRSGSRSRTRGATAGSDPVRGPDGGSMGCSRSGVAGRHCVFQQGVSG